MLMQEPPKIFFEKIDKDTYTKAHNFMLIPKMLKKLQKNVSKKVINKSVTEIFKSKIVS